MRQVLWPAAAATLALSLTACAAAMNVSSHVASGLDFSTYKTVGWGPPDELPTGDPRLDQNPFFQDHVQGAVEKGLAAQGFEQTTTGTPDLLIHYHASITTRVDVNRIDREYGYCYGEDCEVRVVEFEAGTLVLDLVDARTKQVIWRGWAQHRVGDILDDPDEMAERITEAVSRMLQRLPAGGGRATAVPTTPKGDSR
ncbi:MAG: DUF4136 domain-containing protein [Acidobacteriota bacterium]